MDYDIYFDAEENIVIIETFGPFKVEIFPAIIEEGGDILKNYETANILADHSKSDAAEISSTDVRKISQFSLRLAEVMDGKKFALIMNEDLEFGLGRMWQAFTELKVNFEIMVFRTKEEGQEWLTK